MTSPLSFQQSAPASGVSEPSAEALPASVQTEPAALSGVSLRALDNVNPRYLTRDQRRMRDGLYPERTGLRAAIGAAVGGVPAPELQLRIMRQLSPDEHAHGVALARAGASQRAIVRELQVTRHTARTLWLEAHPEREPAPEPEQPTPAPAALEQPTPPVTHAPEPEPAPAELTAEQRLHAAVSAFGKAFPNAR